METGGSDVKKILICDDDQDTLDALSVLLRNAGYEVLTAHEHNELSAKMRDSDPDLILLDVRMPERDGFWIAEGLQVLGRSIPIILMTAYDRMIYRLYAPFVGCVEYLVKPIDPRVLLSKINHTLAGAHSH